MLNFGIVVSAEEFAHLIECLAHPAGPSPTILAGQTLLATLKPARLTAARTPDGDADPELKAE